MTVTYPVVERIRQLIVTRVTTMTVEGNETSTATDIVEPTRIGGYSPSDYQIVVTQDEATRNEPLSTPGNPPAVAMDQTYTLRCKLVTSETDETAIDLLLNVFAMDTQKRVTSYSNWYSMNGLALDARFDTPVRAESSGGAVVVNLPLIVTYRVSETNPYTVR